MNILLIGSGGREHALAWKLSQSEKLKKIYIAPGNAGTQSLGENIELDINNAEAFRAFCTQNEIEMIIVGPEIPLVEGLYDRCKSDPALSNIAFIGPSQEGAKLEGSKAYAKEFMAEYQIPTAAYQKFEFSQLEEAYKFLESLHSPYVLKADGLAAGKGVLILDDLEEAKAELQSMLSGKFGASSNTVVIEEFLSGLEFSVFVLTDGEDYVLLPEAKDYKRIGEGDTGLNTGGMGAVSPVPFVDEVMMQKVIDRVVKPTIHGIKERGIIYQGFIFIGLIEVDGEPKVIEYNCRLGDPETEVVIPRIKNDLISLFQACTEKTLATIKLDVDPRTASTVMLVSGGYPEAYEKGKLISHLDKVDQSLVFLAGSKESEGSVRTNGGRVLALTSFGEDIESSVSKSLKNAEIVDFEGKYYRSDIGKDLMK